MKRRGFLGFMGGAAVAGPSMAKQALETGLESMQVGGGGAHVTENGLWSGQALGVGIGYEEASPMDDDHWMQRQLRDLIGMSEEEKKRHRLDTHVSRLDPDLVANRSFSLSAKLRIQRDRDFARSMASQERYLRRQIAKEIENWAKKGILR